MSEWYQIANQNEVASPALLLYPDRIEENLRRMIAIAGGVEALRPHVKTHKIAEIVRMKLGMGAPSKRVPGKSLSLRVSKSSLRTLPAESTMVP